VVLAGRGFGKTRTGAEWVRSMVCGATPLAKGRASHIALIGETAADVRDVMVQGAGNGLLAVHSKDFRPTYVPSNRCLTWPNGAVALTFNATEPDQLRGPQHDLAWCDELAKWRYAQETWDMLQFGLRLGEDPRQLVTTTPRPIPLLRQLLKEPGTVTTRGSTYENRANLAKAFFEKIITKYEGTRLGRQELKAEILDDIPGSLWTRAGLDQYRVSKREGQHYFCERAFDLPDMQRVVVAIDPAASTEEQAESEEVAETGIVTVGLGVDGRGYVLDDQSCQLSPNGWARRALSCYDLYEADAIVVEKNNGGAMVANTIRAVRADASIIEVWASRGKVTRAEPVSALYEQGKISHVGTFAELEDQMVLFTTTGIVGDTTADRTDALVWGVSELFPSLIERKKPGPKRRVKLGTMA
jgi:phage terminase large subunit-like protein